MATARGDDRDLAEGTFMFPLSLLRDRHASGIVYFAQSTVVAVVIEVEALYGSEEALRAEACALRRSQGQYGIGVLVSLDCAPGSSACAYVLT